MKKPRECLWQDFLHVWQDFLHDPREIIRAHLTASDKRNISAIKSLKQNIYQILPFKNQSVNEVLSLFIHSHTLFKTSVTHLLLVVPLSDSHPIPGTFHFHNHIIFDTKNAPSVTKQEILESISICCYTHRKPQRNSATGRW